MGLRDGALDHLASLALDPELAPARYQPIELVARGGMGAVYRAWDRDLDREVALKVLAVPEDAVPADEKPAASRMLVEARILARLEHPGMVPVYESGRLADGRLFYAMRLVRGQRLDQVLAADPSLPERLRIFGRICETVAFAHAHGVLHRDLKPENVMVGPFGEVLVLDWGVAKVLPRATAEEDDRPAGTPGERRAGTPAATTRPAADTSFGAVVGTPGYMAPEQARGESGQASTQSDVYSLGSLLHFLLTGKAPNPDGVLPAELEPVPRPLAAICRQAMAPEPSERYPTVEALARDVDHFMAGLAVAAYPEGLPERVVRFLRRYRAPILVLVAYLAMRVAFELWRRGRL